MTRPSRVRAFRFPWRTRRQVADDVETELAFHLARKAEALVAAGLSPDDARREAARQFGDLDFTRRYCRDEDVRREREIRQMTTLHEMGQDVRYALRALRAAPGFTLVALLTLALGIGANAAIFSVVRGVLLRPLPFADVDRTLRVWHVNRTSDVPRSQLSEPDFLEWKAASRRFATLGGYWYAPGGSGADLTGGGTPERIEGAYVTDGFWQVLGTPAALGRTMRAEETVAGNDRVMVLSDAFWSRRFAADPAVVGRALLVGGVPHTVIGVMPPEFTYPAADRLDFWIPLSTIGADGIGRGRDSRFLDVVGRLAPGATLEQARDELATLARATAAQEQMARGWDDVLVQPVRESIVGDVRRPLLVLLGAVCFVLLITCVNIAGLLLARASARQRELAVRAALGAGRGRLVRQLVTESLVLAFAGGILGVALAWVGVRAFGVAGAAELPGASRIALDAPVLLYALGVSTLAGLLFGLLPAFRATARNLQGMLRAGARGTVGAAGGGLRSALVVAEVALAVVLVVGAGLAARSFARLLEVQPGFDPQGVLAVRLSIPDRHEDRFAAHYGELLARIAAVPGVEAVGAAKHFPLRGTGEAVVVTVPGSADGRGDTEVRVPLLHVSRDWFRAMRVPLRAGRTFTDADDSKAPFAWVVNEAFARRHWPNESAVGRTVQASGSTFRVIGVVGDVRQASLTEPAEPAVYIHYLQNRRSGFSIAVRTRGDPLRHANAVRQAIWSLDRDQTLTSVETMDAIVGGTVARPRLLTSLLVLFGVMGLALGVLGIYGVLAYAVSQRRQEIGVRMALGASPRSVLRLVVGQGMGLALVGVAVGVAGALALSRVMASELYEIGATDPATFVTVVLVLLGAAFVASWLPARRALRISPVQALRAD